MIKWFKKNVNLEELKEYKNFSKSKIIEIFKLNFMTSADGLQHPELVPTKIAGQSPYKNPNKKISTWFPK
jgi:hypothetical protein